MIGRLLDFNEEHLAPVVFVEAGRENLVIGPVPTRGRINADIAVVEEKLVLGIVWVPVKHRTLLQVPGVGSVEAYNLIVVLRVDDKDCRGVCRLGHTVDEIEFEAENVAAGGIPGNGATLTDVSENVMFIAGGDLLDGELERSGFRSFGAGEKRKRYNAGDEWDDGLEHDWDLLTMVKVNVTGYFLRHSRRRHELCGIPRYPIPRDRHLRDPRKLEGKSGHIWTPPLNQVLFQVF